jgi:hypothetical protein
MCSYGNGRPSLNMSVEQTYSVAFGTPFSRNRTFSITLARDLFSVRFVVIFATAGIVAVFAHLALTHLLIA